MKRFLALLLVPALAWGQALDLTDDKAFEEWSRNLPSEVTAESGSMVVSSPVDSSQCNFPTEDAEGRPIYAALFKNCACACLRSSEDPREVQKCVNLCVIPGTFDKDGKYHPAEKGALNLRDAGDFKTFYDYSLRGNGSAFGVAYELTDGFAKVPWGPKKLYMDPDTATKTCASGWKKELNGRCSRGHRLNLTTEVGVSQQTVGFHFGLKFIPVFEAGVFVGFKYNFEEDEQDVTLGIQWIKLSF